MAPYPLWTNNELFWAAVEVSCTLRGCTQSQTSEFKWVSSNLYAVVHWCPRTPSIAKALASRAICGAKTSIKHVCYLRGRHGTYLSFTSSSDNSHLFIMGGATPPLSLLAMLRPSAQLLCRMSVVFICAVVAVLGPTPKLVGAYTYLVLTAKVFMYQRVSRCMTYAAIYRTSRSLLRPILQLKLKG
jgi:hypothetical protein